MEAERVMAVQRTLSLRTPLPTHLHNGASRVSTPRTSSEDDSSEDRGSPASRIGSPGDGIFVGDFVWPKNSSTPENKSRISSRESNGSNGRRRKKSGERKKVSNKGLKKSKSNEKGSIKSKLCASRTGTCIRTSFSPLFMFPIDEFISN